MRSQPSDYELVSPGSLEAALRLLHHEPGQWLPIAGGTEIMVMFGAGRLAAQKLVNLWNIRELRAIRDDGNSLSLGGGCTFGQIRNCAAVQQHFPLLAQAASWTGSIANQNRATLAGNLANASPAADSSPALLAYDAQLDLVSAGGARRIPYSAFHLGYKRTALRADELILSVSLNKDYDGYFSYARKTGARNAQAIAKVCIAAVGVQRDGIVEDVRIGLGAVAPVPLRLGAIETLVRGRAIDGPAIAEARRMLDSVVAPIDDIRSTADYRRFVAGNLLEEFLRALAASGAAVHPLLAKWNGLSPDHAAQEILPCCGSLRWATEMATLRPLASEAALLAASDRVWWQLNVADWDEAFRSHPRIGERKAAVSATQQSSAWSRQEQGGIDAEAAQVLAELASANDEYEARFGRVFLICATGKSAAEMLAALRHRLGNDPETELHEAAEQQRQITQLRLRKWLAR